MSPVLHLVLILGSIAFTALIVLMLCRETLDLRYTLTWLLAGVTMIVLAVWPQIAVAVARAMGVVEPVNAVYLVVIGFAILVSLSLTVAVSRQAARIGRLAQEIALLKRALQEAPAEEREQTEARL